MPTPLAGTVALVTDTTASLPEDWAASAGVDVIPLHVVVGRRSLAEGVDISGDEVAALLREGTEEVTTSSPAPGELVELYREVARRRGAKSIVSVHLSGRISRTVESAQLAAAVVRDEVTVTVVDSRTLGLAMGYAVCAGAEAAGAGADAAEVAGVVKESAAGCSAYFYVDTLEYLRRGGRIGKASALLGGALAIKPLLTLADGEVKPWERVRTQSKAMARLLAQTVAEVERHRSAGRTVQVGVHHCDTRERAETFAEAVRTHQSSEEGPVAWAVDVVDLGAVLAVHTGPGTLAVVVSPGLPTAAGAAASTSPGATGS
ncbi:MAG: DegV family protein [Ornithinimicrobium sp.]